MAKELKMFVKMVSGSIYKVWEDNYFHAGPNFRCMYNTRRGGAFSGFGKAKHHKSDVNIIVPREFV